MAGFLLGFAANSFIAAIVSFVEWQVQGANHMNGIDVLWWAFIVFLCASIITGGIGCWLYHREKEPLNEILRLAKKAEFERSLLPNRTELIRAIYAGQKAGIEIMDKKGNAAQDWNDAMAAIEREKLVASPNYWKLIDALIIHMGKWQLIGWFGSIKVDKDKTEDAKSQLRRGVEAVVHALHENYTGEDTNAKT